jgi:hypothetical protein
MWLFKRKQKKAKKEKFQFPIALSLLNPRKWSKYFDNDSNSHSTFSKLETVKQFLLLNNNLNSIINNYIVVLNRTVHDEVIKEQMLKHFLYCFLTEYRNESDIVKECSNILKDL